MPLIQCVYAASTHLSSTVQEVQPALLCAVILGMCVEGCCRSDCQILYSMPQWIQIPIIEWGGNLVLCGQKLGQCLVPPLP